MYCSKEKKWLKVTIVEQSDAASNYRGEWLGAVMAGLVIRAAAHNISVRPYPRQTMYCDNRGVIQHSNAPRVILTEKQHQSDLIRLVKLLCSTNKCTTEWAWVEGHSVERKGWRNCSIPERLNHKADGLAKSALLTSLSGGSKKEGDFPFETIRVKLSGRRVYVPIRQALERDWGYRAGKELFDSKEITRQGDFHRIWWDGLNAAMGKYPKMYRVWITKHVSNFCGNNVQLYHWSKGRQSPKCEFCKVEDEYTMHIARCRDPGRTSMFQTSVSELTEWLRRTLGEYSVAATVEAYLLGRGETTMKESIHGTISALKLVADDSDRLGWDSLIEGRISTRWQSLVSPLLRKTSNCLQFQSWGRQFISRLHNILHKQWLYRNIYIHFRGKDGLTIPEHQEVMNRVEEHALTDPETLLPRHRYLLEEDFKALGGGQTSDRLLWLASMDSATAARNLAALGTLTPDAEVHFNTVIVRRNGFQFPPSTDGNCT